MTFYNPPSNVDIARGFDVFRGTQLLQHFNTYEDARKYADAAPGRYLRYWLKGRKKENG